MKTIAIILIAIAFTLMGVAAMAQTKPDTAIKAKYNYFVVIPFADYQSLMGTTHDYKDQLIYNPLMEDKDVRASQANLNAYLFSLPKRVKLDSVLIKKDTTTIKPSIKK